MNLVLMKQVNQCYRFFFLVRDGSNVYDKKMRSQLLTFGAAGEKPTAGSWTCSSAPTPCINSAVPALTESHTTVRSWQRPTQPG